MIQDADLTALFEAYNPPLASDSLFLQRLQNNLKAVEIVKSHTEIIRHKNRRAGVIASVTGFIIGVICTLSYDTILEFFYNISPEICNYLPLTDMLTNILSAIAIGALILSVTYFTFDIVSGLEKARSSKALKIG